VAGLDTHLGVAEVAVDVAAPGVRFAGVAVAVNAVRSS